MFLLNKKKSAFPSDTKPHDSKLLELIFSELDK